jgi:hypothetical protein
VAEKARDFEFHGLPNPDMSNDIMHKHQSLGMVTELKTTLGTQETCLIDQKPNFDLDRENAK